MTGFELAALAHQSSTARVDAASIGAIRSNDGRAQRDGMGHCLVRFGLDGYRQLMKLTPEDIAEFREIWKTEFGETISADDAQYHASRLVELFRTMARNGRRKPKNDAPRYEDE